MFLYELFPFNVDKKAPFMQDIDKLYHIMFKVHKQNNTYFLLISTKFYVVTTYEFSICYKIIL